MSTHPDADAFIQAVLRDPSDTTTRLVFADWLEETGTLPDRAWAYYLRLRADAQRLPDGSRQRNLLEVEAATHVPHITARLSLPVGAVIRHHRALIPLLPTAYVTVNLADHEIPLAVVELVPESVARENWVLPLALRGHTLLVVMTEPHNRDTVQKLEFILNKDIVAFRGETEDIRATIDRHYGQTETESVTSVHYDMPVFSLSQAPDYRLAGLIVAAFEAEAKGFVLRREGDTAECELIEPRRTAWGPTSFPATVLDTLADALLALDYTSEHRFPDRLTREVEAVTVGRRIQRYSVEIDTSEPRSAVTLRFDWR
jgi:uncharacterized protein (TIGR02996 family)